MGYIFNSQDSNMTLSMARFEKVSFEQFASGFPDDTQKTNIHLMYDSIKLPQRGTFYSAGYDFYLPYSICLGPGYSVVVPTGIRALMNPGYFLMCVPRSGLGFKYGVRLKNTVGIIDADYQYADNEGHIMAALTSDVPVSLNAGDRFMQGIFIPFGITADDNPIKAGRTGGFGSTGGASV